MLKPEDYSRLDGKLKELDEEIKREWDGKVKGFYARLYNDHYICIKEIPFDEDADSKLTSCLDKMNKAKINFKENVLDQKEATNTFLDCINQSIEKSESEKDFLSENCFQKLRKELYFNISKGLK